MKKNVVVYETIVDVSEEDWNRCSGKSTPYVLHSHFLALEKAGVIGQNSGINPRYVVISDESKNVIAVAAAFLKFNSEGELGVDIGLPIAHERLAGSYYPKLVVETPFVPIQGPRLMISPGQPKELRGYLLEALELIGIKEGAKSVQVIYGQKQDFDACIDFGFTQFDSMTFEWQRESIPNFATWTSSMHKKGRARVSNEYLKPKKNGLDIRTLPGSSLSANFSDWFTKHYLLVYERYSTKPWLNEDYFNEILIKMRNSLEFIMISRQGKCVGGILCFVSGNALYAHHWINLTGEREILFPAMFHAIESAIIRDMDFVNFQPLGDHKPLRGIRAMKVNHAMRFFTPKFNDLADGVSHARSCSVNREMNRANSLLPYKKMMDQ